ncbi:protein RALF-like 32 [Prunus yedoensis var. nudiflora]|uniref:Protein RALF-like 32 n=1 Tax=Prunus yedoensis var. nudiflora TaxID=2094558 RepID=A0A314XG08_PRUYE|nr:protein RALF-like 32 [Prunus yedoensis var. nudiflora]
MVSLSLKLCFLLLVLGLPNFSTAASWMSRSHTSCNASIAECDREGELLMKSEISRRFFGTKKYISPGALKPDQPVCNGGGKGEAYSKPGGCLPPPSNPHNRGCSKYYHCQSGW